VGALKYKTLTKLFFIVFVLLSLLGCRSYFLIPHESQDYKVVLSKIESDSMNKIETFFSKNLQKGNIISFNELGTNGQARTFLFTINSRRKFNISELIYLYKKGTYFVNNQNRYLEILKHNNDKVFDTVLQMRGDSFLIRKSKEYNLFFRINEVY